MKNLHFLLIVVAMFAMSGCSVIEGIFKAGAVAGIRRSALLDEHFKIFHVAATRRRQRLAIHIGLVRIVGGAGAGVKCHAKHG